MAEATPCYVCGTMVKGLRRTRYSDGDICIDCMTKALRYNRSYNKTTAIKYKSAAEIKELLSGGMAAQARREMQQREERSRRIRQNYESNKRAAHTHVDNKVRCPKCGCESVSGDKKGFGVGKAVVGSAIAGPIGLVAGNIGAKKVRVTCLKCGHNWMAG